MNFLNKYRNFNISEDKLSKWYEENKEIMLNQREDWWRYFRWYFCLWWSDFS
ncbi:hypothetical protein NW066_03800 [Mycoplasmopsis felis]|uniref:hypothetical protein n=1 Tax=Mycoplasmopsis felis TaxID=33923 RepID=UPI0021AE5540|nr:hypothetical protein [Mycoplasmopsis felis]UWV84718.1 hypothetical protein NW066_03800 [Mycoplasmopsis felis]